MSPQKFHPFPGLPLEIRRAIWTAALPGPRVVNIRQKTLRIKPSEWASLGAGHKCRCLKDDGNYHACSEEPDDTLEHIGTPKLATKDTQNDFPENGDEDPHLDSMPYELGSIPSDTYQGPSLDDMDNVIPRLVGIVSDSLPPNLLFVCRESYEIAARFYQPSFAIAPAIAQTYFDFDLDTLYLRYNHYDPPNDHFDRMHEGLASLSRESELWRVKNLALLIDIDFVSTESLESVEEILAEYLKYFGGVEKLTMIMQHFKKDATDNSTISLLDPVDIDALWWQYRQSGFFTWMYQEEPAIPFLVYDGVYVDEDALEEFRVGDQAVTVSQPWQIPDEIEYKVAITRECQVETDELLLKIRKGVEEHRRKLGEKALPSSIAGSLIRRRARS